MRTRNNKLINFILEFSQVLLVFLGVFSAVMCPAVSLGLTFDRLLLTVVCLVASILFYGLFTVLETFRKGKLYGILGITAFYLILVFRFWDTLKKGLISAVNAFLIEFMNFTGVKTSLLTYGGSDTATVRFAVTLFLILISVYLIVIVSAFFYRRRRSVVFLAVTLPFAVLPMVAGKLGVFSNLFTYLIVLITIVGTRHLRTDATDRRMRQKLSILLMMLGLMAGTISYLAMPPGRYEKSTDKMAQTKNTITSLAKWGADDVFAWMKAYFNDDALRYGKIGDQSEIHYTGETLLKLSGDVNKTDGMYLKAFVGDVYENNRWTSLRTQAEFQTAMEKIDNWHVKLRTDLADSQTSGRNDIWDTGYIRIRNLSFGYGNYVVPYLPVSFFKYEENGKVVSDLTGIDYTVEYYKFYSTTMRKDMLAQNFTLAAASYWEESREERKEMTASAEKFFLQVPDSLQQVCADFKTYLKENGDLYKKFQDGSVSTGNIIQAVKQYIVRDTTYSLSPGKTPEGTDTVTYFLNDSKKGYCVYYATTAAILLRSVGIPARYVEGMYVSKEELADCDADNEIAIPDRDAHAWIEVYQDKYGFVPVEVTPGYGEDDMAEDDTTENIPPEPKQTEAPEEPDDKGEEIQEEPEMITPTPNVTEVPQEDMIFEDIDGNEDPPEEDGHGGLTPIQKTLLVILAVVFLTAAALEIQRRIRKMLFNGSLHSLSMKRKIRMVHHHLTPLFTKKGVVFRGQTMAEYTMELAAAMEIPPDEMGAYTAMVFHARFGPDDITEEQLNTFCAGYETIRQKAYQDAKMIKKLYYMYIMVL